MNPHVQIPAWLGILFLAGLFAHAAGVLTLRAFGKGKPDARNPLTFVLQSMLFLAAGTYALRRGAFSRDLISPLWITAGLVLGHAVFAFSLGITHQVWRDAAVHFFGLGELFAFFRETPALLGRFLAVSFAEETIYRAGAQALIIAYTGKPWLGILAVALIFSLVHKHFLENTLVQSAEFLGFSLLLGVLYYATGSLSLVLAIHTVRNLESTFLEYAAKVNETGDPAAALAEIERQYARRPFSPWNGGPALDNLRGTLSKPFRRSAPYRKYVRPDE